jgi:hypothetical protein
MCVMEIALDIILNQIDSKNFIENIRNQTLKKFKEPSLKIVLKLSLKIYIIIIIIKLN